MNPYEPPRAGPEPAKREPEHRRLMRRGLWLVLAFALVQLGAWAWNRYVMTPEFIARMNQGR